MEASIPLYPLIVVPIALAASGSSGAAGDGTLPSCGPAGRSIGPDASDRGSAPRGVRHRPADGSCRTWARAWRTRSCSGASSSCWQPPATTSRTAWSRRSSAWPLGGFLWSVVTFFANVFVGLVLASVLYYVVRRTVVRPARLALTRDAFVILGLIFSIVLTELVGDAFLYVIEPRSPGAPVGDPGRSAQPGARAARHATRPSWASASWPGRTSSSCSVSARTCRTASTSTSSAASRTSTSETSSRAERCGRWTSRPSPRTARSFPSSGRRG